jgi:hypothetical protein
MWTPASREQHNRKTRAKSDRLESKVDQRGFSKRYGSASLLGLIRGRRGCRNPIRRICVNGWCVRSKREPLAMKRQRRLRSVQARRSAGSHDGDRPDRRRPSRWVVSARRWMQFDVRFTPKSRHSTARMTSQLWAITGLMHRSKRNCQAETSGINSTHFHGTRVPVEEVAVGTEISLRPPHRSRRALLTHRAPTLDGDEEPLFGPRVQDAWERQVPVGDLLHSRPR